MKYGVLVNVNTDNIGDDIQSYAQRRFLPSIDYVIDREKLDTFGLESPMEAPVSVIMNSWYMYQKFNWPPSPNINPLFVSMHVSQKDYFGIGNQFLDGLGGEYLKQFSPIGARDESTLTLLQSKGIESYLSGCLTLTLDLPGDREETDEVILADVSDDIAVALRKHTPNANWVTVTHSVDPMEYRTRSMNERFAAVEALLGRYRNAKCVITERLHCALPCLALGVPVLLVYRPEYLDRMSTFIPLLYTASVEEVQEGTFSFDVTAPTENPTTYLKYRRALKDRCERFIRDTEKGEITCQSEIPLDRLLVWQKNLLGNAELTFRKTIEDLQEWILSRQQTISLLEDQLAKTRQRVSELEGWTTELEKAKAWYLEQIACKDARISELEKQTVTREKENGF